MNIQNRRWIPTLDLLHRSSFFAGNLLPFRNLDTLEAAILEQQETGAGIRQNFCGISGTTTPPPLAALNALDPGQGKQSLYASISSMQPMPLKAESNFRVKMNSDEKSIHYMASSTWARTPVHYARLAAL